MKNAEVKAIKENIKALEATKDVQLARQVDAYFSGVMAGYQMAKGKEEEHAEVSNE